MGKKVAGALAAFVLFAVHIAAPGQVSVNLELNHPQPPVIGLPFSADGTVRLVQHLSNGTPLTSEMKFRLYRSTAGVERYNCTLISAADSSQTAASAQLQFIVDSERHRWVQLDPRLKIATVQPLPANAGVSLKLLPQERARFGGQFVSLTNPVESDLGKRMQGMMQLVGKRITWTIPAAKVGASQDLLVTADAWWYPDLKLVVEETDQNPLSGERRSELTNISGQEPDPALFEIPSDYTVKERPALPGGPASRAPLPPKPIAEQIQSALASSDAAAENSLAYALAQSNTRLADAETLATQAVASVEQRTADIVAGSDSNAAYTQTVVLTSFWDTLGWVLFRENKPEQAERYLRAAWEIKPNPEYALHLGSIDEALGRSGDAAAVYRMALSTKNSPIWQDDFQTRLAKLGQTTDPLPMEITAPLPQLTWPLNQVQAEPLIDVRIGSGAAPAVTYLNGDPADREALTKAIQGALAGSLPDHGPEIVLRRARVACATVQVSSCALHFQTPGNAKPAGTAVDLGRRPGA